MRAARWMLPGLVLVAMVASCGRSVSRESLIESLVRDDDEVTTAQASCVVDRLLDGYELADIEAELTAEAMSARFEEDQFRALFACGVEGDVGEQITEQLVANGVSAEDAPCVSDELVGRLTDDDIDVLLSGEITDAFYAKFFAAMESCGAVDS